MEVSDNSVELIKEYSKIELAHQNITMFEILHISSGQTFTLTCVTFRNFGPMDVTVTKIRSVMLEQVQILKLIVQFQSGQLTDLLYN